MFRVCHVLFVLCLLPALLGAVPAVAAAPGAQPPLINFHGTFEQTVPVNIVLVGFRPEQVDRQTLLDALPATSRPGVRSARFFYGLPGRDLGLAFHFRYRLLQADELFEDDLFAHLSPPGSPARSPATSSSTTTRSVTSSTWPGPCSTSTGRQSSAG